METCIYIIATIITVKAQIIGNCSYYPVNVLPTPINKQQTVYLENENCIYLFGGENATGGSHIVYKWNLSSAADGFIQIATTPQNKNFYSWVDSVVSIGNIAYFVGMHDGSEDSGLIYMFDMQQESWIDNSNLETHLPIPSTYGCVSTNLSHIFMIGGYKGGGTGTRTNYHNYLQIYDVQSNIWISMNISFISEWSDQYCSMVDNTLYVFGGLTWNSNSMGMRSTNIMYKWVWNEWTSLGTKIRTSRSGTTAYYNNIIYIIGGGYSDCDMIEIFNVSSESITNSYTMLDPLWYLSSVVIDSSIYIIGGKGSNDFISQNIQICDLITASSEPTLYPTINPTLEPTYNSRINDPTVEPTYNPISKSDDVENIFNFTQLTFTQIIIGICIIITCCWCPLLIGIGICFIYCHRSNNKPTEPSVVNIKVSNSNNVNNEALNQPGLSDEELLKDNDPDAQIELNYNLSGLSDEELLKDNHPDALYLPGLSDEELLKDNGTDAQIELINYNLPGVPSQHTLNIEGLVKAKNQLTALDSMDKKILNNALNEVLDNEKKINLNIIDSEMSDGIYEQFPPTNNNEIENDEKMSMQPIDSMHSDAMYHQFETKNGDIIKSKEIPQINNNEIENDEKMSMEPIDSMLSDGMYHQNVKQNNNIETHHGVNSVTYIV